MDVSKEKMKYLRNKWEDSRKKKYHKKREKERGKGKVENVVVWSTPEILRWHNLYGEGHGCEENNNNNNNGCMCVTVDTLARELDCIICQITNQFHGMNLDG